MLNAGVKSMIRKMLIKHIRYENVCRTDYYADEYDAYLGKFRLYHWAYGCTDSVSLLGRILGYKNGYDN